MELAQFLQLCNLAHIHGALVDAGVEQMEDLRRYFYELKELCPEGYRDEMAATLGCKKIDLSRLITAIQRELTSEDQSTLPMRRWTRENRRSISTRSVASEYYTQSNNDMVRFRQLDRQRAMSERQFRQPAGLLIAPPDLISAANDSEATYEARTSDSATATTMDTAMVADPVSYTGARAVNSSGELHLVPSSSTLLGDMSTSGESRADHSTPLQQINTATRRITVQQLQAIASTPFGSSIQRRAKYRKQIWHERYLMLHDDALYRFKSRRAFMAANLGHSKALQLNSASFALRVGNKAFAVHGVDDPAPMLVNGKDDLFRWLNFINAHVLRIYMAEHQVTAESFEVRYFPTSQWLQLQKSAPRRMGVRALPVQNGPRTGATIAPGEIAEVVGIYPPDAEHDDEAACFKLAGDEGWLCQTVYNDVAMLVQAPGREEAAHQTFRVAENLPEPLPVRFGPSFYSQYTGNCVPTGQWFYASRRWIAQDDPYAEFLRIDSNEYHMGGWVQVYDAASGDDRRTVPRRPLVHCEDPFGLQLLNPVPVAETSLD